MNCYIFFLIFILTDASLDLPSCWGLLTFHTDELIFKHMNIYIYLASPVMAALRNDRQNSSIKVGAVLVKADTAANANIPIRK